ncbi:MAG: A/G-specific adenine glycosylase [Nitrosomonadales bacterium]|nr:A/G-specific adenine glycosylase [Nitrosomonadales bacterium]
MSNFSSRLIRWQRRHGRHGLPWQGADAYRVWLSEIMLQQTQVATVLPYYQRFIAAFPTAAALAAAGQEQVLAHWSGLGYYARGRNLHRAAQLIAEKYHGEFPRQYEQILELPGIGRSTAAAICAMAWHEHRAILDGNVKRVLARHCGIEGSSSSKAVETQLWQQAEALLPQQAPQSYQSPHREKARGRVNAKEKANANPTIATYTQALMDLGATLCTRSRPKCGECPVQADCIACQTNRIHELPTPRPRKTVPEKHSTFLLLLHGNDILLEKRAPSGIWGGLWCPPQFDDEASAMTWCEQQRIEPVRPDASTGSAQGKCSCEALPTFTHTFTHFKLHITPLPLRVARKPLQAQQPGSVWLDVEEALRAAIPAPVRRVLKELLRNYS